MTLVERIQELCNKQGTTLIALERDLGFGRGTIRKWDTSSPSIDKLGAVADHFNTTVDYLRSGIKDKNNNVNSKIKPLIDSLDRAGDLQDEDIEDIREQVEFLINLKRKKRKNT